MNSSGLLSIAGTVTLSKTKTPVDSNGLNGTLAAYSSFWLEFVSTHPRTLTPMNSSGLLWTPLVFCLELQQSLFLKLRLLWTPMVSTELLQPIPASDLSLSLLILELWLLWTPMDSSGLLSRAGTLTLSKTKTPMDSNGLNWTLAGQSRFWPGLVYIHSRTLTHMDSNGLNWTLAAYSSFWLELVSTYPRTLTPMDSSGSVIFSNETETHLIQKTFYLLFTLIFLFII